MGHYQFHPDCCALCGLARGTFHDASAAHQFNAWWRRDNRLVLWYPERPISVLLDGIWHRVAYAVATIQSTPYFRLMDEASARVLLTREIREGQADCLACLAR